MRVTIRMTNGDTQTIEEMPDGDVMELVDEFSDGDAKVLAFQLDQTDIIHIARCHIVSILAEGTP